MEKLDVDFIEVFLPPSPSSSAAPGESEVRQSPTMTEVYDYCDVLFSAVGQPHESTTGRPLNRQKRPTDVDQILANEPQTKIIVLAR